MRALLDAGMDVDLRGAAGETLLTGCSETQLQPVERLLEHGADPNAGSSTAGARPLCRSLAETPASRDLDITQALLSAGADPSSVVPDDTRALLQWAVDEDIVEATPLLLRHSATLPLPATEPLSLCAIRTGGSQDMVQALEAAASP